MESEKEVPDGTISQPYSQTGGKLVHAMSKPWTPESLTIEDTYHSEDGNKKFIYGDLLASTDTGVIDQWEEFDVTEYVRDVALKTQTNYGFTLQFNEYAVSEFNSPHWRAYLLSSLNEDIEKRPKLEIVYSMDEFLTVDSPNGGDTLEMFQKYEIKWASNINDNVTVELIQNSSVVSVIADNISNTGVYTWKVPLEITSGDSYKIRIRNAHSNTILDESDSVFSIISNNIIKDFPYVQDFDNFTTYGNKLSDYWMQEAIDDFDWTVHSGKTPSNHYPDGGWNRTGPGYDHTGSQGNYLYTEATGCQNKRAEIYTPIFDLKNMSSGTMSFWYHMWAEHEDQWSSYMGKLEVYISVDGVWQKDAIFYKRRSQGNMWKQFEMDISEYSGSLVQFKFKGTTATYASDIAIDDFKLDVATNMVSKTVGLMDSKAILLNGILKIHNSKDPISLSIFNLAGRVIKSYQIDTNKDINFKTLPSGFYLLKLESEGYSKSLKLCIK